MADAYDTADLKPYATKQEVHEYYETLSDAQKAAFNKVYTQLREFKFAPANAWFGQSINPAVLEGKVREYARDAGFDAAGLRMLTYNLVPK